MAKKSDIELQAPAESGEAAGGAPEAPAPAPLPTVKLKNKTRRPGRMVTVNLPHEYACTQGCRCEKKVITTSELNPRTGERGFRETRRGIPSSLTLQAGEVSGELPPSIANAPEVKAAVDRGELAVLQ